MGELSFKELKDLGLNKMVKECLPYKVVGGAWEGSLWNNINTDNWAVLLNHIIPAGQQLKMLFLRVWTTDAAGARFSIFQTNPTALGQTGTVEAFQVVGSVPAGVRDYPMLEAAGAEVLGPVGLASPVHVFEGSIEFRLLGFEAGPADERYSIVWWGVEAPLE